MSMNITRQTPSCYGVTGFIGFLHTPTTAAVHWCERHSWFSHLQSIKKALGCFKYVFDMYFIYIYLICIIIIIIIIIIML
jgi:hypothetical protein